MTGQHFHRLSETGAKRSPTMLFTRPVISAIWGLERWMIPLTAHQYSRADATIRWGQPSLTDSTSTPSPQLLTPSIFNELQYAYSHLVWITLGCCLPNNFTFCISADIDKNTNTFLIDMASLIPCLPTDFFLDIPYFSFAGSIMQLDEKPYCIPKIKTRLTILARPPDGLFYCLQPSTLLYQPWLPAVIYWPRAISFS